MKIRGRFVGGVVALAVLTSFSAVSCKNSTNRSVPPAPSGAALAEKTIRLQVLPAHVGDKIRETRSTEMKLSAEFWQDGEKLGTQESLRSEDYAREAEVLALVGGVPGKVKVHYERYHFKEAKPDAAAHEDSSIEGKSYIVDGRDRETKATSTDGKPVTPEEMERLERVHADLAVDDKILAELRDKNIPVGSHSAMRESLFRALVTTVQGEFKSGSITLIGTRVENGKEAAAFDWSAEMHTEEESGMETTWHIKGECVVDIAPAVVVRATMKADVDAGGQTRRNGARIDIAGSGTMRDERTYTPL